MTPAERAAPTIPAPPDRECGCGAVHDVYDWIRLPLCGVMRDAAGVLELRNCTTCSSTIAVLLCSVDGCNSRAMYQAGDGLHYCTGHEREWSMPEDREDFASEWAREAAQ